MTAGLPELRLRAEEHLRDDYAPALLDLVPALRGDAQQWPHVWAPAAAITAHRAGQRPDAVAYLLEAIDAGFSQPEFFEGDLEACFADHPDWPAWLERMRANVPPPPIELLSWPTPRPALPLELSRIAGHEFLEKRKTKNVKLLFTVDSTPAEREAELRKRLPEPKPSAWDTACELLAWVARRWRHANDHAGPDAIEILDRVEAGARFACDEYAVVLAQGLNALGIPGRRVGLCQRNHHAGVGRAHSVAEAWIDDLDAWVLLDGQNGAYWQDEDGRPLGTHELNQIFHAGVGRARPELVCLAEPLSPSAIEFWWTYFATVSTDGASWLAGPFSPVFQERFVLATDRLVHDLSDAYPKLSDVWISVTGTRQAPALRFGTAHPYASGFAVDCGGRRTELSAREGWPLDLTPGEHEARISVTTPFGDCTPGAVTYRVSHSQSSPKGLDQ